MRQSMHVSRLDILVNLRKDNRGYPSVILIVSDSVEHDCKAANSVQHAAQTRR